MTKKDINISVRRSLSTEKTASFIFRRDVNMNPYFPNLFSPMKVKKTTYRNRIFCAPSAWKDLTDLNHITERNMDFLKTRARGGAASVCLGEAVVHPTGIVDYSYKLPLYDIRSENSLYNTSMAINQYGAVACVELNHGGMHFHQDGRINYGPSPMVDSMDMGDGQGAKVHEIFEMPKDIIAEVVESYGTGAKRAKHCGFGAVLIHAGHGWLLHEFLSPVFNKRTDEYGGSLENRARFLTEAIASIRKHCGRDFIIEVRISWKEGLSEGLQLDDMIEVCKLIEKAGADMIQVSCGSIHYPETTGLTHPSWFDTSEGVNVEAASKIKAAVGIKVGAVAGITDPNYMEQILAEGKVDYVVMNRAIIADPDLPKKAMHGRLEDIRPCLRCIACLTGPYYHMPMFCSVNPVIGKDTEYFKIPKADTSKRVLVVGGGAGGMEAALTAAQRGHEVILCEKSDRLGGLMNLLEYEPFKVRIGKYKRYMEYQLGKSTVDVRLNTEVTPELVKQIDPDYVIAAVGAAPAKPPVKGIEKGIQILELYANDPPVGENVVMLGGGFAGIECAIGLGMKGKKVTIVEMMGEIASSVNAPAPGNGAMQVDALWDNIRKYNIQVMVNTKCVEITDHSMICEGPDGIVELPADTVVYAAGMVPRSDVVDMLRETCIDFAWVGDCNSVGLIKTAVHAGFNAAMAIE